jgi:hypothetical protein
MGDLAVDTRITGGGGRYTATLARDWEIWGPIVALRDRALHRISVPRG